jgi:putative Mg2+ transporter-C (MgtC) family protein
MSPMPAEWEQLARLLLAALLGGAIGAERELSDQPAGPRTHMLLTIGACLFTLTSAYGFGHSSDPSRVAAQIVTGIGFLGGGAILRHGATVRGMTTAGSIWATTAIGVVAGTGRFILAIGSTVLILGTLTGLKAFRNVLRRYAIGREEISFTTRPGFRLQEVTALIRRENGQLRGLDHERVDGGGERVTMVLRLPRGYSTERLLEALTDLDGVREVDWSE